MFQLLRRKVKRIEQNCEWSEISLTIIIQTDQVLNDNLWW